MRLVGGSGAASVLTCASCCVASWTALGQEHPLIHLLAAASSGPRGSTVDPAFQPLLETLIACASPLSLLELVKGALWVLRARYTPGSSRWLCSVLSLGMSPRATCYSQIGLSFSLGPGNSYPFV